MNILLQALKHLESWFLKQKRVLPWRDNPSVYRVWISEIMLQQTQVKTVVPYFERFLSRFPDVKTLAEADLSEILAAWSGLGYYSRAKNLHQTARLVMKAGGKFPENRKDWLELPGIGEYTAGAVCSIALGIPEAILDANVKRVVSRLRMISTENKNRCWKWSKILVKTGFQNHISPQNLNQALMELGALICLPRNPDCLNCPVNEICKAYKKGKISEFTSVQKKDWTQVFETVVCIFDASNNFLLSLDYNRKWRKELWDFPSSLPVWFKNIQKTGETACNYTVTRHQITREILVYRLDEEIKEMPENYRFTSYQELLDKTIPAGSQVMKTLKALKFQIFV